MAIGSCDVCGKPATNACNDIVETDPVRDESGTLWATWEKFGDTQYGCDEHPTKSATHYQNGTVEIDDVESYLLRHCILPPDIREREIMGEWTK